jgi:hypothetical protein
VLPALLELRPDSEARLGFEGALVRVRHQSARHRDREAAGVSHLLERRRLQTLAEDPEWSLGLARDVAPRGCRLLLERHRQRTPEGVIVKGARLLADALDLGQDVEHAAVLELRAAQQLLRELRTCVRDSDPSEVSRLHGTVSLFLGLALSDRAGFGRHVVRPADHLQARIATRTNRMDTEGGEDRPPPPVFPTTAA